MQHSRGPRSPGQTRRADVRSRRHQPRTPGRATAKAHSLTFTSRAAVLGLALCAVVVMLAYPGKELLGQRSANSRAEAQQAALQKQIAALTQQHAAAQTPAQIEAQARAQLHYTLPGTRNYIVLSPPKAAPRPVTAGNAVVPADPDQSWYGRLWSSDVSAGR